MKSIGLIAVAVIVGCGPSGPQPYPVSGTVTYHGEPVRAGLIIFAPDATLGNPGPAIVATIENGQYRTLPGKGMIGGPHRVTITGFAQDPTEVPEEELGQLFPRFETTVDLPREKTTRDFDIPSSSGTN